MSPKSAEPIKLTSPTQISIRALWWKRPWRGGCALGEELSFPFTPHLYKLVFPSAAGKAQRCSLYPKAPLPFYWQEGIRSTREVDGTVKSKSKIFNQVYTIYIFFDSCRAVWAATLHTQLLPGHQKPPQHHHVWETAWIVLLCLS